MIQSAKISMPKIAAAIAVGLCMTIGSHAEDRRTILLEEFSNVGCGPCAELAPHLDSLLHARLGEVVGIQYHVWWPDRNDEFYLNEKESQDARVSFYGVTAAPTVIINGVETMSRIDIIEDEINRQLETPPQISLDLTTDNVNGHLTAKVAAEALTDINSPNLRLHIAVIEESAKSSEGTHYTNIFRKMLPDDEGFSLPESMTTGDKTEYTAEWDIAGLYDESQLAVIAFVQDSQTHKILQTDYVARTTSKTDAAGIISVTGMPDLICEQHCSPTIRFRNLGSNDITSATINLSINGSVQQTEWTGRIGYLENATVTVPDFTDWQFSETSRRNDVEVWISDVNGTGNESSHYVTDFTNAIAIAGQVRLTMFTDLKPEETGWTLYDPSGTVIASRDSYEEPRTFYREVLPIGYDGCYRLAFHDKGGDGITGENGNGYFRLEQIDEDGKATTILQEDFRTAEHAVNFRMHDVMAGIEILTTDNLRYDRASRTLFLSEETDGRTLEVYDLSGRLVMTCLQASGSTYSLEDIPQGIYVVRVCLANGTALRLKVAI